MAMEDDLNEGGAIWTDEKHTCFLNCLEDSFVRWMRTGGGIGSEKNLRLDRNMPDVEDSTEDCSSRKLGRRRMLLRHRRRRDIIGESHGKTRKHLIRRQAVPQQQEDQVVPLYEETKIGKEGMPDFKDARLPATGLDRRSSDY